MFAKMRGPLKVLWSQIKSIPGSSKKMYIETKQAYRIKHVKGISPLRSILDYRTRYEHELVRSNAESLIKFGTFFLIQLPPIVGYVVVVIAMQYPKYLLTHHFWTSEQLTKFREEEYLQRQVESTKLSTSAAKWGDRETIVTHLTGLLDGSIPLSATRPSDLLARLACTHAVFHYEGIQKSQHYALLPQVLLLGKLRRTAVELMTDDLFFIISNPDSEQAVVCSSEARTIQLPDEASRFLQQFAPVDQTFLSSTHIIDNVNLLSLQELRLAVIRRGIGTTQTLVSANCSSAASMGLLDISTADMATMRRMLVVWLLSVSRSVGSSSSADNSVDAVSHVGSVTVDPLLNIKNNHRIVASYIYNVALGLP